MPSMENSVVFVATDFFDIAIVGDSEYDGLVLLTIIETSLDIRMSNEGFVQ